MTEADDTTAGNVNTNERNFTCSTATRARILSEKIETIMSIGKKSATDMATVIDELTIDGESNERKSDRSKEMINENTSKRITREMNHMSSTEITMIMIEKDPPTEWRRKSHDAQRPANGPAMKDAYIAQRPANGSATKAAPVAHVIDKDDPPTERRRKSHDARRPSNESEMMNDDKATGQCMCVKSALCGRQPCGLPRPAHEPSHISREESRNV
ncbi:hypothetical protein QAD02_003120 [Eretmocerus hayati]|uniref:Uncharacterized protein n=1 Tax=Eretmocerus hayati TaxID=131215 RepID=A0ACC2NMJ9_9HYME|nr:hypothetical protein QAD02_003120 [Eretmocerus hayati]